MQFTNKVIIVTGAASGIGAKTSELFSKEDARLVIVDINEEGLKKVAELCKLNSSKTHQVVANIADDDDVKRVIEEAITQFGNIDVLVNCAAVLGEGNILDGSILKRYDEILNVNVRAVIQLTTLAAPHLIKTNGNIINISSVKAVMNTTKHAYDLSKAAVEHFTRGSAIELSTYGVRVNAVRPGPVKTKLLEHAGLVPGFESWRKITLLNRISEPEEIADLILYLASDKAKGITGSVFTCDNGALLKNV